MSDTYRAIVDHITRTVQAPPTGTITKFPSLGSAGFRSVDTVGGARAELEEMVGQNRVFEVSAEGGQLSPIPMGGAIPSAYVDVLPIRMRYEGTGPHRKAETVEAIKGDQFAIVDALQRSSWPGVAGLVSLSASPGNITRFVISDEAGNSYEGYISEIACSISFDI